MARASPWRGTHKSGDPSSLGFLFDNREPLVYTETSCVIVIYMYITHENALSETIINRQTGRFVCEYAGSRSVRTDCGCACDFLVDKRIELAIRTKRNSGNNIVSSKNKVRPVQLVALTRAWRQQHTCRLLVVLSRRM